MDDRLKINMWYDPGTSHSSIRSQH